MRSKINHALEIIDGILKSANIHERNIAVACSFGKDSMVTLHLARQVDPNIQVFSVMTPYKFKETFAYKDYITALWNLNIKTYQMEYPDTKTIYMNDIERCCNFFKVEPTKEAIRKLDLGYWITGLRNTEGGDMRKFTKEIEEDKDPIKINPILSFTEKDIWLYHAIYNIPVHPLYLEGYRSLGCEPCSAVGSDSESERATRWGGKKTECGIHTQPLK